ncbi:MAG: biopolymer transporter ExbD [Planctomycetes bacterium]|nr:biopolymer transporter ExbD [Planctomycetota bacterium]
MNFCPTGKRKPSSHASLNLSSMIDVTFLLLIYFIITTVIATPEDALIPALKAEKSSTVSQDNFEPQIIHVTTVNSEPVYQLGDRSFVDRQQLAIVMKKLPKDPGVIFRVDNNVSIGFAIAAIQEARNTGFEKVTYVPKLP